MKAIHLKADGTEAEITPANGTHFTLAEMQAAVGGYVELQRLTDGRLIILNEEGNLDGLPTNEQATILAYHLMTDQHGIVGDVIICDSDMVR